MYGMGYGGVGAAGYGGHCCPAPVAPVAAGGYGVGAGIIAIAILILIALGVIF